MKTPIAIMSTDWHLKRENINQIKDLFVQKCEYAVKNDIKHLFCLGDVFDSRIAQRQDVLNSFEEILQLLDKYDLELTVIPGNHDKTDYSSKQSFLVPFKHHRKLHLVELMAFCPVENVYFYFIPFFNEDMWVSKFNELINDDLHFHKSGEHKTILLTHVAVTGSRNNDGTLVSSGISTKMFKDFFKVFSGHYHDQQKIGENFYHIPSIQQNNYGENSDKGFTVVYDDGSHELIHSNFRKYIKVEFDIDEVDYLKIINSKTLYDTDNNNIRFIIKGSENKLKAVNKEEFLSSGIDIKLVNKEIEETLKFAEQEIVELNSSIIIDEFKKFCEKEEIDYEQGVSYLKQMLKWS